MPDDSIWREKAEEKKLPEPFIAALAETVELAEPEKEEIVTEVTTASRRGCRAYSPRGTKCKLCGKVHPL